jgi:hypothetical protein
MSKPKRYARIAITLPATDLAAADRLARRQDRSRSWIVAEAIRRYATLESEQTASPAGVSDTPESRTSGLGSSRLAQLRQDLALTPEQRVRAADETLRLSELRARSRTHRLQMFDRFEDYLERKRQQDVAE